MTCIWRHSIEQLFTLLMQGVTGCETCDERTCENGGICQEANSADGYVCICKAGQCLSTPFQIITNVGRTRDFLDFTNLWVLDYCYFYLIPYKLKQVRLGSVGNFYLIPYKLKQVKFGSVGNFYLIPFKLHKNQLRIVEVRETQLPNWIYAIDFL